MLVRLFVSLIDNSSINSIRKIVQMFSVFLGRGAGVLLKLGQKIGIVRIAYHFRNGSDGCFGVGKHSFGVPNTVSGQVLVGRLPAGSLKLAQKVVLGQGAQLCQIV